MRRCFIVTAGLLFVFVCATAVRAAEPREVIERAIKAAGGAEKLAVHNASTWKEKGTYYGMGDGLPYTGDYAVHWPDKFRMEIQEVFTIVINGNMGWVKSGGEVVELEGEQLEAQEVMVYTGWVTTLTPLKDKVFQLSNIGEADVDGKPADGVRVKREGKVDVDLFFEKESGLLVKSSHRAQSQEQGKEVGQDTFYRGYKEIDGARVPTKILVLHDGAKFVEAETFDLKATGKLDDSVFAKPQ